jgi:Zn-dependent protease
MTDTAERPVSAIKGAKRIVRLFGIDVHVHWSWLLAAVILIQFRQAEYDNILWNVVEYVCLFLILHEFGHALACRSVGGKAENILLWPLGGVAYVRPPQRPGAVMWSLAAGPLVNVVIAPFTIAAAFFAESALPGSNIAHFCFAIAAINLVVFFFNVLPIYPLDGGQMLRALLWWFVGPHKSLLVATVIGMIGAAAGLVLAVKVGDPLLILIVAFGALSSWSGFRIARARNAIASLPRHGHVSCPDCREAPPQGNCWPCPGCARAFDPFQTTGACAVCANVVPEAPCPYCGAMIPIGLRGGGPVIDVEAEISDTLHD